MEKPLLVVMVVAAMDVSGGSGSKRPRRWRIGGSTPCKVVLSYLQTAPERHDFQATAGTLI